MYFFVFLKKKLGLDENRFKKQEIKNELFDRREELEKARKEHKEKIDTFVEDEIKANQNYENHQHDIEILKEEYRNHEIEIKSNLKNLQKNRYIFPATVSKN